MLHNGSMEMEDELSLESSSERRAISYLESNAERIAIIFGPPAGLPDFRDDAGKRLEMAIMGNEGGHNGTSFVTILRNVVLKAERELGYRVNRREVSGGLLWELLPLRNMSKSK
jgi:hypothetical protein